MPDVIDQIRYEVETQRNRSERSSNSNVNA